jgi:Cytochrome c peroxidase
MYLALKRSKRFLLFMPAAVLILSCSGVPMNAWQWSLPPGVDVPEVPADNPMSAAKVVLGERLFFDNQLTANQAMSCSSCHHRSKSFSEGLSFAVGSTGEKNRRNSATLVNLAFNRSFTWGNAELEHLEEQIVIPLFGTEPLEMGATGREQEILQRFKADQTYRDLFASAFPGERDAINFINIVKALASYLRSLNSFNSAYDRFRYFGDSNALNESELRGFALFNSDKTRCSRCHSGVNLNEPIDTQRLAAEDTFHNTGLYSFDVARKFDDGLFEITQRADDHGKFKTPTLRNIEVTSPYMHDGSINSLEEIIDFYAAGGRLIERGWKAGDGRAHPNKSSDITGFVISAEEKRDLIAFLKSLTDREFISVN